MQILYELRYPSRLSTKILMALLALAFFAVLATTAIAGFLVYRIVKPQRTSTEINMASFPGRPEEIGRASCRERVEMSVVGASITKKKVSARTMASTIV